MKILVLLALVGVTIAFDCSNDGIFVDPDDCAVFHRYVAVTAALSAAVLVF
jgi:hypothetical protein